MHDQILDVVHHIVFCPSLLWVIFCAVCVCLHFLCFAFILCLSWWLQGGFWVPKDGLVNPSDLAQAFVKGAVRQGDLRHTYTWFGTVQNVLLCTWQSCAHCDIIVNIKDCYDSFKASIWTSPCRCLTAPLNNVPCRGEGDGRSVLGKSVGREGEGDWSANRQRRGQMWGVCQLRWSGTLYIKHTFTYKTRLKYCSSNTFAIYLGVPNQTILFTTFE